MANIFVSKSRIVPFLALHEGSPSCDRGARERISRSIERHQGNIDVLVHPGFFTVDNEGAGNASWFLLQKAVEDPLSGYNLYRARVKKTLSGSERPLFIFHDRTKSGGIYGWALGTARADNIVIVETQDSKPLPYMGKDEGPGDQDWDLFRTDLIGLGVKTSRVFGEYLHNDGELFFGCVNTAYKSLHHSVMKAGIYECLTYPYGVYQGCSER